MLSESAMCGKYGVRDICRQCANCGYVGNGEDVIDVVVVSRDIRYVFLSCV